MRIPFIAAWARADEKNRWQQKLPITAGAGQRQVANVIDIFPTLLHLVGAEDRLPSGYVVDGVRLDALLTGTPDPTVPNNS